MCIESKRELHFQIQFARTHTNTLGAGTHTYLKSYIGSRFISYSFSFFLSYTLFCYCSYLPSAESCAHGKGKFIFFPIFYRMIFFCFKKYASINFLRINIKLNNTFIDFAQNNGAAKSMKRKLFIIKVFSFPRLLSASEKLQRKNRGGWPLFLSSSP